MNTIANDFDRIATHEQKKQWGHNSHYHNYLLSQISGEAESVLDVGCGSGDFCELLARKSKRVVGIDLSSNMIKKAQSSPNQPSNILYQVGDYLNLEFSANEFDYIFSIATVHHFSLTAFLEKAKREVKPGGKIVILDVCEFDSTSDRLTELLAIPANWLLERWYNRGKHQSEAERLAWKEHQARDHYLTLNQVRSITKNNLPTAIVSRHLFWRYSLIWVKPA